jgi:hypothetical protein
MLIPKVAIFYWFAGPPSEGGKGNSGAATMSTPEAHRPVATLTMGEPAKPVQTPQVELLLCCFHKIDWVLAEALHNCPDSQEKDLSFVVNRTSQYSPFQEARILFHCCHLIRA